MILGRSSYSGVGDLYPARMTSADIAHINTDQGQGGGFAGPLHSMAVRRGVLTWILNVPTANLNDRQRTLLANNAKAMQDNIEQNQRQIDSWDSAYGSDYAAAARAWAQLHIDDVRPGTEFQESSQITQTVARDVADVVTGINNVLTAFGANAEKWAAQDVSDAAAELERVNTIRKMDAAVKAGNAFYISGQAPPAQYVPGSSAWAGGPNVIQTATGGTTPAANKTVTNTAAGPSITSAVPEIPMWVWIGGAGVAAFLLLGGRK